MQIYSINNTNYKSIGFGLNLQSKKLQFKEDDFYVMISGYGHHSGWAKKIRETADNAVKYIREKCDFDGTLEIIVQGVKGANNLLPDKNDSEKKQLTGILREYEQNFIFKYLLAYELITPYAENAKCKYKSYEDRLDYINKHPLKNPYNNIKLTRPKWDYYNGKILQHASARYINNAFDIIKSIFEELHLKYIINEVKVEDLPKVNSSMAEIRWVLAHATPWKRGSDAISNTLIRSIYKAIGIKTSPLKRGVSLDLEAYCTNLNDYKENFANYFIKKPEIIN